MSRKILLIDNFDSFVFNLAQAIGSLGGDPVVLRSDTDVNDLAALHPDGVVISPGPGRPEGAGVSIDAIHHFAGRVPVLGVCLGHQAIAVAFGAVVERADAGPVHGKPSEVIHNQDGLYSGISSPLDAIRYHSLAVRKESLPVELAVTATSTDETIMGIRHTSVDVEGVQFHPESILTTRGPRLLENFLERVG